MKLNFRILSISILALSSCSGIGGAGRYSYDKLALRFQSPAQGHITVVAYDNRPFICSHEKPNNFVGLQRGAYGIPHNVTTTSTRPLADEIAKAVGQSLQNAGAQVQIIPARICEPSIESNSVKSVANDGTMVALYIKQWRSDSMVSTSFDFDLTIQVRNLTGQASEKSISGHESLEGTLLGRARTAQANVLETAKVKLEELLNSTELSSALSNQGALTPLAQADSSPLRASGKAPEQNACSISQILEMKKLNMTDVQIHKACG